MHSEQVVRDLYSAFSAKDEARLRQVLHPDVEWIQCAGFPGGGHRRGVDEVLEKVFAGLRSEWDGWRVDIDEYISTDASVVVLGSYAGTHSRTKRPMEAVFAHVYDVVDGRITRFRQITDTAPMVEAAAD